MLNKLMPFAKYIKKSPINNGSFVIADQQNIPLGFVFNRDAFISLLEKIDEEFESKSDNNTTENSAGKLIDLIEDNLPLNDKFMAELDHSTQKSKQAEWIPFEEIMKKLYV